jgi:hypothetical protein
MIPTGTLIRQVLAAVAQFDKTVTVLKVRAARERKRRETGRYEDQKPLGDAWSEVERSRECASYDASRSAGKRLRHAAISKRLNAEGHSTRSGRPWAPGSVHAILTRLARRTRVGQIMSDR